MKKILLSLCAVSLLLTGCGKNPKLENGQDAVVTVKEGTSISMNDLYTEMKDRYAIGTLVDMMDSTILGKKYPVSDEETKQIESQISTWLATFQDEATLLQQTQTAFGISTMEGLRNYLSLQYKRGKAVEDYMKSTVTDKEVDKFYNDTVFGDIKASHILIKSEATSSMTTEEKTKKEAEALQKAKDIITRLNNGEDFATIAKELSQDDSNKEKGGDLGFFSWGEMTTEFETAAKKLAVGAYSKEPVKTSYGYHIILKVEQKEKTAMDSIKDKIKETVANNKLTDEPTMQITALMETRKNAGMVIEDKTLASQYELLMKQTKEDLIKQKEAETQ